MNNIYLSAISKLSSFSLKSLFFALLIGALIATNIATLASATFFSLLHGALSTFVSGSLLEKSIGTQLNKQKQYNKELEKQKRNIVHKNRSLTKKNNSLLSKNATLLAANQSMTKSLKQGNTRLRTKVASTTQSVKNRMKILASTTVLEAPLEAVPFLGIAVIAGTAAFELHTACETMKELYSLEVELNPNAAFDNTACGMEVPTTEELRASWSKYYDDIGKAFYEWFNN